MEVPQLKRSNCALMQLHSPMVNKIWNLLKLLKTRIIAWACHPDRIRDSHSISKTTTKTTIALMWGFKAAIKCTQEIGILMVCKLTLKSILGLPSCSKMAFFRMDQWVGLQLEIKASKMVVKASKTNNCKIWIQTCLIQTVNKISDKGPNPKRLLYQQIKFNHQVKAEVVEVPFH